MPFCTKCGEKIESGKTCSSCSGPTPVKRPPLQGTGKKWLIPVIAVLVIIIFSALYNSSNSADQIAKKLARAVAAKEYKAAASLLENNADDYQVIAFVDWLADNPMELQNLKNSIIYGGEGYYLRENRFLLLKRNKIDIDYGTALITIRPGCTLTFANSDRQFIADEEGVRIGAILPGTYDFYLQESTPFGQITGGGRFITGPGQNSVIDTWHLEEAYYTVETDLGVEGELFVNGISTGEKLGYGRVTIGPVPPGHNTITHRATFPWGEVFHKAETNADSGYHWVVLDQDAQANRPLLTELARLLDRISAEEARGLRELSFSQELGSLLLPGSSYRERWESPLPSSYTTSWGETVNIEPLNISYNNDIVVNPDFWWVGENEARVQYYLSFTWDGLEIRSINLADLTYFEGKWWLEDVIYVSDNPESYEFVSAPNSVSVK